jgi:hypothetical protein
MGRRVPKSGGKLGTEVLVNGAAGGISLGSILGGHHPSDKKGVKRGSDTYFAPSWRGHMDKEKYDTCQGVWVGTWGETPRGVGRLGRLVGKSWVLQNVLPGTSLP